MKELTKLNNVEVATFCSQMAMILRSGVTPSDGLQLLLSDTSDSSGKAILQTLLDSTMKGNTFTESIKESKVFPEYVENMVAIGEESGMMDDVMQSLSNYYEHEETVSENVRSAISYPMVMIVLMLVIIGIIMGKILPLFNQVFIQLGTEMSGISATLLKAGESIQKYSAVFVAVLVLLVLFYIYTSKTQSGKKFFSKLGSKFGPTKKFYKNIAYGRFANGMALTLSSGIGIYQSLDLVAKLVDFPEMEEKIAACKASIENGDNFAEALLNNEVFNNLYSRMIAVGVKTGRVDEVLGQIAALYDEETDKKIRNLISILEPTLVVVLSLIVGLILLSVILPLLGIMATIG